MPNKDKQIELRQNLIDKANKCHYEANDFAAQAVLKARECGYCLNRLKKLKVAGKNRSWTNWLNHNFDGSVETARKYMQVAREWDNPKLRAVRENGIPLNSVRKVFDVLKGHLAPNPESGELEKVESSDSEEHEQSTEPCPLYHAKLNRACLKLNPKMTFGPDPGREDFLDKNVIATATGQRKEINKQFMFLTEMCHPLEIHMLLDKWRFIEKKIYGSVRKSLSKKLGYDPYEEHGNG